MFCMPANFPSLSPDAMTRVWVKLSLDFPSHVWLRHFDSHGSDTVGSIVTYSYQLRCF